MYRLVIPRSLFTQLALLDEGTEGLFTCEESKRLRYVVKSITRGADWYTSAHFMSRNGNAIFGSYRVVPHMDGTNSRKDLAATLASHVHCSWVLSQMNHVVNLPQSPVQFSLVIMKRVRHHIYSTVFAGYVLHSVPRAISGDAATILRRHPALTGHVTRVIDDEVIDLNAEIDEVSKPVQQPLPEFSLPNQEVSELLLELEARLRNHVMDCKLVNDTGLSLHEALERHVDDIHYSDEDFAQIGEYPDPAHGDHVLVNPYDTVRNNSVLTLGEEHDAEIEQKKTDIDTIEKENALLLQEYRELYKQVKFLKVADQVLLPNLEINQPQQAIQEKSRDEFASYGSPVIDHSHVSASREELDMQDMDEDMRRAIELSKLEQ